MVLSISTGGLDATALDLEISARYGVVQTVGDTVGLGGLFRGLRNILWSWRSHAPWRSIALMPSF